MRCSSSPRRRRFTTCRASRRCRSARSSRRRWRRSAPRWRLGSAPSSRWGAPMAADAPLRGGGAQSPEAGRRAADLGPTRAAARSPRTSYYGLPAIHGPHWMWLIITYFFLGGIAGGSYVIASIAELVGPREDRIIVRIGRFVSLVALVPCPLLLILDLGRPERFLNMLRVLKLRSPMSLGSWALSGLGFFATIAAALQLKADMGHGPSCPNARRKTTDLMILLAPP